LLCLALGWCGLECHTLLLLILLSFFSLSSLCVIGHHIS
jgi:hypothetical protein